MELRRHLDPRIVFVGLYILAFLAYIIYGLQPAGAADYKITANLNIPSIDLASDVTALRLENHELPTPDTIVGSYSRAENKTLLIGHSSTVFQKLNQVELKDIIEYDEKAYQVVRIDMVPKAKISMDEILSGADNDTIVIMTCAGQMLGGGDATHRLMLTAVKL